MTATPKSDFADGRARAAQERTDLQRRAVRTIASNARDGAEFTALLSMLGLDDPTVAQQQAHHLPPLTATF